MFRFINLYSGSSGNCSFIESDNSKILIDCGASCKKTEEALNLYNTSLSDIDAILITHEHSDHIKGLATTSKKFNIPIYANKKTMDNIKLDLSNSELVNFKTNQDFDINDLKIHSFSIPHDAADPCGFSVYNKDKKISIATDIGHMTTNIIKNLEGSDFLLLEANYSPELLRYSRYPYLLKQRIVGPNGHLSNDESGNTISSLLKSDVKNIMLGHLSKENNFPELAYQTVMESLINKGANTSKFKLSVADRDKPNDAIEINKKSKK